MSKIYKNLVKSEWFKKTYKNKSVGEVIKINDNHAGYYSNLIDR